MKFKRFEAHRHNRRFLIEEDYPEVGWYLHIWEDDVYKWDYLQNTMEVCIRQAERDFGVPINVWKEIEPVQNDRPNPN